MTYISVFTPTYNRISLLKRLYKSLIKQTSLDFEWVVVDDASTDGTEAWFDSVVTYAPFHIDYKKVSHGGKHRAINTGVKLAKGDYFFIVDSDDYLPKTAIETIYNWLNDVKDKDYLAGVSGIRIDSAGNVIGESPLVANDSFIECSNLERYRSHLNGDKAEIYRTNLLKRYPFPEFKDEYFVTERLIWDRIANDGFKIRWYNSPIYICEYQASGLTNSGANSLRGNLNNYCGFLEYVKQSLSIMEPLEAVTVFRQYNYVAKYKKKTICQRAADIDYTIMHYLYFMVFKVPFYYLIRICRKVLKT